MIVTEWEQGILDGQIEIRPGLFNCTVAKLSVDYLTHFPLAAKVTECDSCVVAVPGSAPWQFQRPRPESIRVLNKLQEASN
jgi:hypothetical protein